MKKILIFAFAAILAVSCGTVRKAGPSAAAAPTPEEARSIVAAALPEAAVFQSKYMRVPAGQRIFGICIKADGLQPDYARFMVFENGRKGWNMSATIDYPSVPSDGFHLDRFLGDSLSTVVLQDVEWLHFRALGSDSLGRHKALVSGLYSTRDESFHFLGFSGKDLSSAGQPYKIEGRSNELMVPKSGAVSWISAEMAADPMLIRLSDADIMTDDAVSWWLEKNPAAMTSASSLNFGVIPAECSLVSKYKASKDRQSSARYRAAMFDYRGYTSVVAQNRSTGEYLLVWTEPECKDHARGRLLNNIYFEQGGSSLVLFYYQGKRTFKYRINLSSKTLRR